MVKIITPALMDLFKSMTEEAMPDVVERLGRGQWVNTGGGTGYYEEDERESFRARLMPLGSVKDIRDIVLTAGRREASGALVLFYPMEVEPLTSDSEVMVNGENYWVTGVVPEGSYTVHRIALLRLGSVGEEPNA